MHISRNKPKEIDFHQAKTFFTNVSTHLLDMYEH